MFIWKISSDILKGKTAHVLFSVQKEMQKRCADCFTCRWFPCGNNHFQVPFFSPWRGSLQVQKAKKKCWCLLLDHHIDLYQSGSQTCSYAQVGIHWRISILPVAYRKQKPKQQNLKKKEKKKAIWSGTLYHIFFLCFVLLVCCVSCCLFSWSALVAQFARAICLAWLSTHLQLCLVVHFFILPFHLLGSLHTCCLPLSSNPTCSPKAVEFSTGGIVRLRHAAGEGRAAGGLVGCS